MAHFLLIIGAAVLSSSNALKTCPGFPGYCSESFVGQTCNVVCSFGRNNVPLCQEDGTWTDIPRCIEHEPGVEEQITGICPGIPGYCSQGFLNSRCNFKCATGPAIDSLCNTDGTWLPYPVCEGDLRETRDGCDGCPGPNGGIRNRTAEEILTNNIPNNRIPKISSISTGRKEIPSFAGSTKFGVLQADPKLKQVDPTSSFFVSNDGRIQQRPASAPQFNSKQQMFLSRFPSQQQQQFSQQQPQQQQQIPQQQQTQQQQPSFNSFQQQTGQNNQGSLFNQIKNRINNGNRQEQEQQQQVPQQQPRQSLPIDSFLPEIRPQQPQQQQPLVLQQQPQESFPAVRQQQQQRQQFGQGSSFGIFEEVDLGNSFSGQEVAQLVAAPQARLIERPTELQGDFFGEFPSVNLQG